MAGHKFSPSKAKHLDGWGRRLFFPANKFFRDIKPKEDDKWADIGCGTGYLTIPLAALVREVFAVDVSSEMLEMLSRKIANNELENIKILQSRETSLPLEDGIFDGALMVFVAHELGKPAELFRDVSRILRPGGRLVVIEYAKTLSFGPPMSHRLEPRQIESWTALAGLKKSNSFRWSRSIIGWEFEKVM